MKKFWQTMNRVYDRVMLAVFIAALLVVIYALYDTMYVYDHATGRDYLGFKPDSENQENSVQAATISDDMVAWITLDDTNIDYPVMQGSSNNAYLNTDPFGNYSLSGSIFLDSRNAGDFTDPYSVIYGHHMEYKMMFGALDDYLDDSFLKSHTHGTLLVGRDGKTSYELEVFYAMTTDAKDESVFDPENYELLLENFRKLSMDRQERIVCLSTCSGDASTTRIVVFAYLLGTQREAAVNE